MLTKAKSSGQDPYLAILDWRNTPSPVLDHHQYKDCLDDAQRHCYLQQELCYSQRSWRELKTSSKKKKRNKLCFTNKGTKELPELQAGDSVRMKPLPSDKEKLWRKWSVAKQVAPRSYEVDLQGTMFRRNRKHFVKTKEPSPQLDLESQENLPASSTPLPVEGPPVMQTRSGRVIHRPGWLRDGTFCLGLWTVIVWLIVWLLYCK